MKKLLSLLGSVAMIGTAGASVVACKTDKNNPKALDFTKFEAKQREITDALESPTKNAKAVDYLTKINQEQTEAKDSLKDQKAIDAAVTTLTEAFELYKKALSINPTAEEVTFAIDQIAKEDGYIIFNTITAEKKVIVGQIYKALTTLIEASPVQTLGENKIAFNDMVNDKQAENGIIGWTSGKQKGDQREEALLIVIKADKTEVRVPIKFKINIDNAKVKQSLIDAINYAESIFEINKDIEIPDRGNLDYVLAEGKKILENKDSKGADFRDQAKAINDLIEVLFINHKDLKITAPFSN